MNEPFTLDGNGPAYSHAHAKDFRPTSDIAKLRQNAANVLAKSPDTAIPLSALADVLGVTYRKAYSCAKWLCMRGLAIRSEEQKYRVIKKTGEKVACGVLVRVRHVAPFSSKIGPGKDAGGVALKRLW